MVWQNIESLLRERIGMEPQAIPQQGLVRAIRNRMQVLGGLREEAYLALLTTDPAEWAELVDAVVVHETWFFRDYEPFVFLKKYVLERRAAAAPQPPLRILSVPAATGEEAYSIAMTLFDAGLQAADFAIDALEISPKALQKALSGVYGRASFRERDEPFRRRFFTAVEDGWQLDAGVVQTVHFVRGNLLDYPDLAISGPYEIIFFRNLLIYLNQSARQQTIAAIDAMLQEGGVLFLGYAESPQVFFPHYDAVNHPRSYAACKPGGSAQTVRNFNTAASLLPAAERPVPRRPSAANGRMKVGSELKQYSRVPSRQRPKAEPPEVAVPVALPVEDRSAVRVETLQRAQLLADQGQLQSATELCKTLLKSDPSGPEPYFLLGVIALAQGDEERARENFNRTVYLQPDHQDALMHLSLLMDKAGFPEQAKTYRDRLLRSGHRDGSRENR